MTALARTTDWDFPDYYSRAANDDCFNGGIGGPRTRTKYGYDANGNMTTAGSRVYTWASYNLPTRLDAGTAFSTFVYGPNRERLQQAIYSPTQMTTVNYVGGLFEDSISGGTHTYRNYIATPAGVIAVLIQASGVSDQIQYFTHDHLGSIDTVTNGSGSLLQYEINGVIAPGKPGREGS